MSDYPASQLHLPKEVQPNINEQEYASLQPYIDAAKAMARCTYKSIYIIDYHKMGFLHVSDNPLFLCGESVEDVLRLGYAFYHKHVPEEDMRFLEQINRAGFEFFRDIAVQDRMKYTISYNFHLTCEEKREKFLINHMITPLKLDVEGNIWLGLCFVSLAPSPEVGVAHIFSEHSKVRWEYRPKAGRWKQAEEIELSEQEKAVIRLANQGFSVPEIAKAINKSEDSIKGYRKTLFVKLSVSNISEAIAVATHRKLI